MTSQLTCTDPGCEICYSTIVGPEILEGEGLQDPKSAQLPTTSTSGPAMPPQRSSRMDEAMLQAASPKEKTLAGSQFSTSALLLSQQLWSPLDQQHGSQEGHFPDPPLLRWNRVLSMLSLLRQAARCIRHKSWGEGTNLFVGGRGGGRRQRQRKLQCRQVPSDTKGALSQRQQSEWQLPAKLTHHSNEEISSRSKCRAMRAREWLHLRDTMGTCRNTTAVTQQLIQKEKFHFCYSMEMTFDQKYLGKFMKHLLLPCELDSITVIILLQPRAGRHIFSQPQRSKRPSDPCLLIPVLLSDNSTVCCQQRCPLHPFQFRTKLWTSL